MLTNSATTQVQIQGFEMAHLFLYELLEIIKGPLHLKAFKAWPWLAHIFRLTRTKLPSSHQPNNETSRSELLLLKEKLTS